MTLLRYRRSATKGFTLSPAIYPLGFPGMTTRPTLIFVFGPPRRNTGAKRGRQQWRVMPDELRFKRWVRLGASLILGICYGIRQSGQASYRSP